MITEQEKSNTSPTWEMINMHLEHDEYRFRVIDDKFDQVQKDMDRMRDQYSRIILLLFGNMVGIITLLATKVAQIVHL